MAVFTEVGESALRSWLEPLGVGELLRFEGIAAGIENTNYFVDTEAGRWVLTLFERLPLAQLPFYLGLMRHLAARGVTCPDPVTQADGGYAACLAGKPAALVSRLHGHSVSDPDVMQCEQAGRLLAQMHLAAREVNAPLSNPRGLSWCTACITQLEPFVSATQAQCMRDELAAQHTHAHSPEYQALPQSAVHADLFRDNLLFDANGVSGVIDFYFAGLDTWVYDLAVACNDWCIDDATGELDPIRLRHLTDAYQALRPLDAVEHRAWPLALRRAALRFWLSRLSDWHLPRAAQLLARKDPAHFERILRARRHEVPALSNVRSDGAHTCR